MNEWPADFVFDQLTRAFEASQHFTRSEIVRRQTSLLERLVRHADTQVPFYRDSKRLKPLFRADGAFDFAGLSNVPILTRAEAQNNEEALRALSIPPDVGPIENSMTSGSTGMPLRFRRTALQSVASEALLNRIFRWHGAWPVRRLLLHGAKGGGGPPGDGIVNMPVGLTFAGQVELLRRSHVTHVVVAPSIALGWAEAAGEEGLPDIAALVTAGEVLTADQRRRIERAIRTKVIDLYSTSELGPIAGEGPDGRLRIFEEAMLLEGPGAAPDPARPIRVVATPFYAFAMPLIRYAPGDYVRFSNAGGKRAAGLRRLDAVIGRRRNLMRRPNGELFLPGFFTAARLRAILEFRQWQLVQTSRENITLKIVAAAPPSPSQVEALKAFVAEKLPDHGTSVEFVDSIETNVASGKAYELFLSLVD
jgi:phenylacetate-CoA ligase